MTTVREKARPADAFIAKRCKRVAGQWGEMEPANRTPITVVHHRSEAAVDSDEVIYPWVYYEKTFLPWEVVMHVIAAGGDSTAQHDRSVAGGAR